MPVAFAHPLGNFTINQYAGLHVTTAGITIDYVMDMAEIAAFQEIELLDSNENRQPDASEATGYHTMRCASLLPSLNLSLNNKAVTLSLVSSSVEFPAGVGGLPRRAERAARYNRWAALRTPTAGGTPPSD